MGLFAVRYTCPDERVGELVNEMSPLPSMNLLNLFRKFPNKRPFCSVHSRSNRLLLPPHDLISCHSIQAGSIRVPFKSFRVIAIFAVLLSVLTFQVSRDDNSIHTEFRLLFCCSAPLSPLVLARPWTPKNSTCRHTGT